MQSNHNNKSDKPKFLDTKILIGALAVAVTVGFWNLFSNNAFAAEKTSPSVVVTLAPQPPSYAADNLPPLPTLVPLVDVTVYQSNGVPQTSNVSQAGNGLVPQNPATLRVVGVPTRVITQKQKPVIGAQVSSAQGSNNDSGGGSGGSSSKSSSSTTKSSKK